MLSWKLQGIQGKICIRFISSSGSLFSWFIFACGLWGKKHITKRRKMKTWTTLERKQIRLNFFVCTLLVHSLAYIKQTHRKKSHIHVGQVSDLRMLDRHVLDMLEPFLMWNRSGLRIWWRDFGLWWVNGKDLKWR